MCAVKKVSKVILIGLAVMLALGVMLVVGLNLYVQSPGAQARLQEELSKALRLPLKLTNMSVTPWGDLRITGLTIPNGDANFLEAASFSAKYRLLPLLENKLIITDLRVENPKVLWRQDAEGAWKLPEPAEAAAVARAETADAAPAASPTPAEIKREKKPAAERRVKKKSFAVLVDRFEVQNGAFELLDHAGQPVAVGSGVNMIYTTLTAEKIEGTLSIARAVWSGGVVLENIRTPLSYIHSLQEFWLPEFTATVGGGALRGKFHSHAERKSTPFNTALQFERVSLGQIVAQSGGEAGAATGEMSGKIDLRGELGRMDKTVGSGVLELRDGRFSQLDLFKTIGRIGNIPELLDFRIREGHGELQIIGKKVLVDQLVLIGPGLEVTAKGSVHLDKKVDLEAQLAIDEALAKQLPAKLPTAFGADAQGRRTIDFRVGGTTDKLKTDLDEKFIAQTINAQFGELLGTLLGDKKPDEKKKEEERKKAEKKTEKDRKKKDKPAEPAAPPAPAAPVPDL